jgi:hypothetical protein
MNIMIGLMLETMQTQGQVEKASENDFYSSQE